MAILTMTTQIPGGLLAALARKDLRYTDIREIHHLVWLGVNECCGVCGDGANASYEWFWKKQDVVTTSDAGYGMTEIALLHVLLRATIATRQDADDVRTIVKEIESQWPA